MRKLSPIFMKDLLSGKLYKLLMTLKSDHTLCLEIRENYINIYYRGGNILRVKEEREDYTYSFNQQYCIDNGGLWKTLDTTTFTLLEDYLENIPYLKRELDNWFAKHPKLEREFQQLILRENNSSSISQDTDYFISDIEYANSKIGSRFDMTGIKWLSTGSDRKRLNAPSLVIFELKYGDGAMTGSAGIMKHFSDIEKFLDGPHLNILYNDVEKQYNQKVLLGLMGKMDKEITINRNTKIEFIIICANHKPAKTVLKRELKNALEVHCNITDKVNVKIAKANLMGYGLYDINMIPLNDFLEE